jgi:hypothetical protein
MTSKIVVNNIEADAGVSTVTFGSEISASTFTGNVTGNVTGNLTGNVTSSSTSTFSNGLNVTGGSVGIGTDNPTNAYGIDKSLHIHSSLSSGTRGSGVHLTTNASGNTSNDGVSIRLVDTDLSIDNLENGLINFLTQGSERARITSTGNVQIANGNLVFSTSGTGIDFSATANGSGTTTSELLDDYEEGTFVPNVFNSGSSSRWTSLEGRYRKVGSKVTVWITCDGGTQPRSGTSTGLLTITGIPFSISSSLNGNFVLGICGYNRASGGGSADGNINYAGSVVRVRIGGQDQTDQVDYFSACFSYFV